MGTPQKRPRLFGKDEVGGSNPPAAPVKSLDFQGFFLFLRNPNPAPKSHLVLFGCWGGFFALMPLLVVEVCAWPSLLEAVFTS